MGSPTAKQARLDEELKFKSERTGISNNSFERASKTYFMHQQKMLKKEKEKRQE